MAIEQTQPTQAERPTRRSWETPVLTVLSPLTQLTLQTGGAIPGGGGSGGGGSTVF